MKKKFLKRAAAFAVTSLMAVGMINVLPEDYFPYIGTAVNAEGTYSTKIKIKRIETVNDNITVNVDSIIDTNNNFINDGWFTMWYSVNDYNNILPEESTALIYTYGSNYVDDNGNIGEWGFSGMTTSTPFSGGGSTIYLANHSYDEYYFDLGYADRNADDYESTFVNCVKVYFDPKHTYIEDFVSDETGHWYACNGCGEKIDFAAHTEDDGTVTVEPTETTEGQKEYKCTVCGYTTRTEVVPKLELTGIEINAANFPDEIFRQYISENFDKDSDDLLSNQEISQITDIDVSGIGIQSLKGIEFFNVLRFLFCNENQLTSLDVSKNTALTDLGCNNNQIISLDVSNNTLLEKLDCANNQFASFDISNNTALTSLYCGGNKLISLDVRNNIALTELTCVYSQITSLDVSNNLSLTKLNCFYNKLTSLDVSNNTALIDLRCDQNKLTSLDVSNNTALTWLYCFANQLTSLDVSNNTALTNLSCSNNQLTSLDIGNNPLLTEFGCSNNSYNIGETCGAYDLKNLPTGFDITKASNWQGATLEDGNLTGINGTVSYDYDCGNNHTATFNLKYTSVEHSYDDGVVTIEPTEQSEGEKTYTCTICGATKTEVIARLDHIHNKGDKLVFDETGHWYTCDGCDEKLDFAAHTEDNGTVTIEPTETTEGQKVYKCTVCGYTTSTETIAKLEGGNNNSGGSSQPSQPSQPQQPETSEPETNIDVKKGWGNVIKVINGANENSKINVDMGNTTNVPKNVMNAIKGKNVDIVLDMGDGITWTINGKDVTDPQSIDFSVTKKKNQIPEDMISDPSNTIPLVLAHNGNFGCSATLSIDLKGNDNKVANLYYYNTKTKELEFVDSSVIVNGKASLIFTHASDWAIVISDTSAEYEDVSSAAGAYETDDNSQAPLCIIVIILAALGFSYIIITKRLTKHKR